MCLMRRRHVSERQRERQREIKDCLDNESNVHYILEKKLSDNCCETCQSNYLKFKF